MRTTLSLDDDVAAALADRAHREVRSLSRVANDAICAGLQAERDTVSLPPCVPTVFDSGEPWIDACDGSEALEALDRSE